ncbi:MAG: 4Fe-4S dicluster domain-containing protein [Deltaproteobacteria bacterium]|nr:4Fe-4S dicluster domain-containing protein [Deltaproteobacteria bacterium]
MSGNKSSGVRYGMVIDIDKCTGCTACSVACQQENNVPFREDETNKVRSITWMEIYQLDNGMPYPEYRQAYLPRLCLHCGASPYPPCTFVCPVNATHRDEDTGLVNHIPVRCIGCRYCISACSYHARYFNWWDPKWPKPMEEMLTPNVSPRMRGVVEKCTMCVHRLQLAKDRAFMEGRSELEEGEYVPACVESCPAKAMTFGNLLDPDSEVARLAKSSLAFRLLEKLGTEPKVYYLSSQDWIHKLADKVM